MSKMLIEPLIFNSNVQALKDSVDLFNDRVERFFINEESIKSGWKGRANEAYFIKLYEKKNELLKIYKHYNTLIDELNKVCTEFTTIDSEFAGKF